MPVPSHNEKCLRELEEESTELDDDMFIFPNALLLNTTTYMNEDELEANFAYIEKCFSEKKPN